MLFLEMAKIANFNVCYPILSIFWSHLSVKNLPLLQFAAEVTFQIDYCLMIKCLNYAGNAKNAAANAKIA